ncbi:MAG: glycerol-3-phosphate acyltransferase [Dehalococcoidia bacterium]|jgi:glycerol-3-phosphate acyltransferase PlsY
MELTEVIKIVLVAVFAYLLGSMPTAVLISKGFKGVDVRTLGDGNMGARNTYQSLGPGFGVMVAIIDFFKGAIPVLLASLLGLELAWQFLIGALAILGHDFPVFAGFKGGRGTASTLGTMSVLFPMPTLGGLLVYGVFFIFARNSRMGCAFCGAAMAAILAVHQEWLLLTYLIATFLFIPAKMLIDIPRRRAITVAKNSKD